MGMIMDFELEHPLIKKAEIIEETRNGREVPALVIELQEPHGTLRFIHPDALEWMTTIARLQRDEVDMIVDALFVKFMKDVIRFTVFK